MTRPRKDPAVKALRGTLRKDREPKALAATGLGPPPSAMVAPIPLTQRALEHFDVVAGMLAKEGRASQHFAYTVALLAMRFDQIERFSHVLAVHGYTAESRSVKKVDGDDVETVMLRARPEVTMLSDAMRHSQALLSELMLSPTAAQRIARPDTPKGNSFAGID